ncbi:WSSV179 [White spot syndrome virus]|uniref:WSSV179 n=1 Tax=White spot syndrome virus TaxID=342409 RepID=A0A2I6SBT3_9VIRU|nr:WSSV179 [White spot syndrome virus]
MIMMKIVLEMGNYRMGKPMVYHWDNKLTRDPRAKTASPTTLNL